jgi:hypothetical protein
VKKSQKQLLSYPVCNQIWLNYIMDGHLDLTTWQIWEKAFTYKWINSPNEYIKNIFLSFPWTIYSTPIKGLISHHNLFQFILCACSFTLYKFLHDLLCFNLALVHQYKIVNHGTFVFIKAHCDPCDQAPKTCLCM